LKRNSFGSLILIILLWTPSYDYGADQQVPLTEAELGSFLKALEQEWRLSREKVTTLRGIAEVYEISRSSVLDVPLPLIADLSHQAKPQALESPPQTERREGTFQRNASAYVTFKEDRLNDRLWCRWASKHPIQWLDLKTGSEVMTDDNVDICSVLTTADYLEHNIGTRVSSAGSVYPLPLDQLDLYHQRTTIGGDRGLLFRDSPEAGRALIEASYVFSPSHMNKLGGQSIDVFLKNRLTVLEAKGQIEAFRLDKSSRRILIRTFFRRSDDDMEPLVLETFWDRSDVQNGPSYVLSELKEYLTGSTQVIPLLQVNWVWDQSQLQNGFALPARYHQVKYSEQDIAQIQFDRDVSIESWEINTDLDEDDFAVSSLNVAVGDLVLDKQSNQLSYIGGNLFPIEVGPQFEVPALPIKSPRSSTFFWMNVVFLFCVAVFILIRKNWFSKKSG